MIMPKTFTIAIISNIQNQGLRSLRNAFYKIYSTAKCKTSSSAKHVHITEELGIGNRAMES